MPLFVLAWQRAFLSGLQGEVIYKGHFREAIRAGGLLVLTEAQTLS